MPENETQLVKSFTTATSNKKPGISQTRATKNLNKIDTIIPWRRMEHRFELIEYRNITPCIA